MLFILIYAYQSRGCVIFREPDLWDRKIFRSISAGLFGRDLSHRPKRLFPTRPKSVLERLINRANLKIANGLDDSVKALRCKAHLSRAFDPGCCFAHGVNYGGSP